MAKKNVKAGMKARKDALVDMQTVSARQTTNNKKRTRRKNAFWTDEEKDALALGVGKYGTGTGREDDASASARGRRGARVGDGGLTRTARALDDFVGRWSMILKDPEFGRALAARSNVDLKDKWRASTTPTKTRAHKPGLTPPLSPLAKSVVLSPQAHKQGKRKWTEAENAALEAGVQEHGVGQWAAILKNPKYARALSARSNVDLKDRYRSANTPTKSGRPTSPIAPNAIKTYRTPGYKPTSPRFASSPYSSPQVRSPHDRVRSPPIGELRDDNKSCSIM